MPTPPTTPHRSEERSKQRPKQAPRKADPDEVLRDQAKTETEERPYLDTEGGE